jgi:hypothetical protein
MNEALARIIKEKVIGISMADKVGGLVRPVTVVVGDQVKTYPVAWDVTHADCVKGKYNDLMPNSKYKSLMYFEDGGTNFTDRIGDMQVCQSSLRLIGWVNGKRFEHYGCATPVGACMIMEIVAALPSNMFNEGNFQRIQIGVQSEATKNSAVFAPYTFDEQFSQYLMYPYDYFALNIVVNYTFNVKCLCWEQ